MGRLNQPNAWGPEGMTGSHRDVELQDIAVELLIERQAFAVVHPTHVVDIVHPECPARAARQKDRGSVLADPVTRPGVSPIEDTLGGRIEDLEGRHDRPGREGFDLEPPAGHFVRPLGKHLEIFIEQRPGRPAGLKLQGNRSLGSGLRGSLAAAEEHQGEHQGGESDPRNDRDPFRLLQHDHTSSLALFFQDEYY